MPLTAFLRQTYGISAGIKNHVQGKRFHDQRFRYARKFDLSTNMPRYDYLYSHAYTALRLVSMGKYKD